MTIARDIARSVRPAQWYKNLVLFTGAVFSLNLFNLGTWLDAVSAFIIFCMLSGSQYVLNDIMDMERDRSHPLKRHRPIASGSLKKGYAIASAAALIILALAWASSIGPSFLVSSVAYIVLVTSYSVFLKNLVIVDVLTISTGFVIRAVAGCLAIGALISPWLLISTFLLALFLALGKRRHEKLLLSDAASKHRLVLDYYPEKFLDQALGITTASLLVSYSIYTFSAGRDLMMFTIPLVIYGLFKIMFFTYSESMDDRPEAIFKDRGMLIDMALWVGMVILILYDPGGYLSRDLTVFLK